METKWWLNSTTVRGALMTVVPTILLVLKAFGLEVAEGEAESIVDGISGLMGAVGLVMAIVGRFQAQHSVSFKKETSK